MAVTVVEEPLRRRSPSAPLPAAERSTETQPAAPPGSHANRAPRPATAERLAEPEAEWANPERLTDPGPAPDSHHWPPFPYYRADDARVAPARACTRFLLIRLLASLHDEHHSYRSLIPFISQVTNSLKSVIASGATERG